MKSVKLPMHFKFDINKFVACVALFAKENFGDLDKLKVCKLLYYADKYHLVRYGKPILGDVYVHLDNGPIPSRSLDIMNEVQCNDKVFIYSGDMSNKDKFKEVLKSRNSFKHKFPVFELHKEPDIDFLSGSELEAVKETIKNYGEYSPEDLITMTHKDPSWQKTQNTEEIDYKLFFENDPAAKPEALEYLESLREDLEIVFGLEN